VDWDKNWSGDKGRHLGVVMQNQRRHQKYRCQKARAAWEVVRRLSKLPAKGKRTILTQQLLPILTYGCELYQDASEQQRRLANEMYRWAVRAYPGSRADKVQALVGLNDVGVIMHNKRIRWAASVYARHIPELRQIAEPILREIVGETALQWMEGTKSEGCEVRIEDLSEERVDEWSDGSRIDGRAAGATRKEGIYLGEWATVTDAEEAGVMRAWEAGMRVVALDSQGALQRIANLRYERPRSWIEERLVQLMRREPRTLMWVRGHQGVQGNEEADRKAKRTVRAGRKTPGVATPQGIKQEFPVYPRAPAHFGWTANALRGLVYMVTDKGPQQQWLWEIGKVDTPWCACDGWTPQNAAHLLGCPWVGDGKGRSFEMIWEDEEWCGAVAGFIM